MSHCITKAEASSLPLDSGSVDLIVTSPPYWQKRDYGLEGEIGQEPSPSEFVESIVSCFDEFGRVLCDHGSIYLNVGDTYRRKCLQAVPSRVHAALVDDGWVVRNDITWVKTGGKPDPSTDRLTPRTETVLHVTKGKQYYYDQHGYKDEFGDKEDVWRFPTSAGGGSSHLAPFPEELPRRAIVAACPKWVCESCGKPRERAMRRTDQLDTSRKQAARAMEIYNDSDLTKDHIRAVQSVGISDAGKAKETQDGTGRNTGSVEALAAEAKDVLGGYTREFTFANKEPDGWTDCGCDGTYRTGRVLDPFAGSCTTARAAESVGVDAIMTDLNPEP